MGHASRANKRPRKKPDPRGEFIRRVTADTSDLDVFTNWLTIGSALRVVEALASRLRR